MTIVHSRVQYAKKTNFEIINLCQKQQYVACLPENQDNRYHFELQVTVALKTFPQGLSKHHKIPLHTIVGKTCLGFYNILLNPWTVCLAI